MPTPPEDTDDVFDPEEHIRRLIQQFEKRLRQEIPARPEALPQTLDEIERVADRLGQEVKEKIQKELLEMAGTGDVGKTSACPCQRQARYVAGYKKQVVTRCGAATLWRAYYYCGACKKGFCPLDARLGIGRGQCSVAVRALLSRFASYLPYRTAAAEMETICGIGLSASTVRREAQAVGRALERDWQDKAQQVRDNQAKAPAQRPSSLHLSMDGVLIFVGGRWREVKCAVIAAKQMGAERIIVMSRHETRQKLALEFGATDIVTERGDEGVARIKDMTDGLGAHSVIEAVGTQESMMQSIRSTRPGGHVGFVGVSHGVEIPGLEFFFSAVHLHGGPAPVRRFLPHLIDLVLSGKINPGKVFDLTLPLDQVAEGYRAMDERRTIKTLLRP